MKTKLIPVIAFVLFNTILAYSQPKPYEWEKDRKRYDLSAEDKKSSELILKRHSQYNYVLENDLFIMYTTIHTIIWVNSSEAIQRNNRIYISMNSTLDLVELKARSINKDGKVTNFDKSNLKELKEEGSGNAYRIFAIEGVETGSEVEYFYTLKKYGEVYERVFTQHDAPVKSSSFVLTCPNHLKFDFKSYFGYPEVKQNTENKDLNEYSVSAKSVPALKEEEYSYFDANRQRIEFKLAYNTARSQARLYTWDEAAKTFYGVLTDKSAEDEKALDKFIKTLGDSPSKPVDARIKNIEQKIKSSIQIETEMHGPDLIAIGKIVKNKIASKQGINKLYFSIFLKLGIKCHPVITCSRENIKFDGSFDTWSYLDEYILYFPDAKGYLSAVDIETRFPLVPYAYTSQEGLFLEPISIAGVTSALASIEKIPAVDYSLNVDDLYIDVSFNSDLSANVIDQKREFGGYHATFFAPYYDIMTTEQRVKLVEELTKQIAPDASIKDWSAKSLPEKGAGNFLVVVKYESNHFIEKAGPRILFKFGGLIGPQVEMYRDDHRSKEIENDFNRGYDRKISIHIPEGYTIKNPEDLKMNVAFDNTDNTPFVFQSDYVLKGNLLEVTIKEYYKEIYASIARYEDFRKVVNAAADFNKITLVLEKNK